MNRIILAILLIASAARAGDERYYANLPFAMTPVKEVSFADFRVSITETGGVRGGQAMNTRAFEAAIAKCAAAGGGTVVVPQGMWLTGPIQLKSNVNLHLETGAVVRFSASIDDFPLIPGFDGKSKKYIVQPPLSAYRATNIAVTGDGVFDGSGEAWRYVKKEKLTPRQWQDLVRSGGVVTPDGKEWWPSEGAMNGQKSIEAAEKSGSATRETYAGAREYLRPDLVRFVQCDGILLDGPTFMNSPRFHVYLVQSENIIVRRIAIRSEWYAQNGDGLDLGACRNVLIHDVTVDVGDDGICLKPGRIADRQKPGPACANIVIADCKVYHAHGGFVVGSESMGGAENVSVTNCTFVGTDVGLRFKSLRSRGGDVGKIWIDGIRMERIANEAILFDMFYGGDAPEQEALKNRGLGAAEPVNDLTPRFHDIVMKHIACASAARALLINGLPEMAVKNVSIDTAMLAAEKGVLCIAGDGIAIRDAGIFTSAGPVFDVVASSNIDIARIAYREGVPAFLAAEGAAVKNVRLKGIDLAKAKKGIDAGADLPKDAIVHE